MQQSNVISIDTLTATERKVYYLNGIGKQIKEIADILKSSYETAKCHMKNIKVKLGLQKDKELTAHFWCNLSGKNFDEIRRQIISTCLLLLFLVAIPFTHSPIRENRHSGMTGRRSVVIRENNNQYEL